jgi:phosphate-selective porin OprO/OprP
MPRDHDDSNGRSFWSVVCRLLGSALVLTLLVATGNAQDLVIKDVTLLSADDPGGTVLVTVIIEGGVLEFLTQDDVGGDGETPTYDGSGNFLLGQLEPGSVASFIVLDVNPRDDFTAILDTRAHTVFAIHDGFVTFNTLPRTYGRDEETARKGWLAYTPPPLALPTGYRNTRQWNRFDTSAVSGIFAAAVMLDRTFWTDQDANSAGQVGPVEAFEGGDVRGLRAGFVGTLNFETPWVYTIFGATGAFEREFQAGTSEEFTLYDYRLDIPVGTHATFSLGKQKEPISHQRVVSLVWLSMQERSAPARALLPDRNVGIVSAGAAFDSRTTWAAGIFNDWFDSSQSFGDSASQFATRLTWLASVSADENTVQHFGIGYRYTDAKEGQRYSTKPEISSAPVYVDTGEFAANDASTYSAEYGWRSGPVWLMAEYFMTDPDAPASGNPRFYGYDVTASWALTGEVRPYHKRNGMFGTLPVAESVRTGGWGAWEVATRWSYIDLADADITGGEMSIASVGFNWWLTPQFAFSTNYRFIDLNDEGVDGSSEGLVSRVVLFLE